MLAPFPRREFKKRTDIIKYPLDLVKPKRNEAGGDQSGEDIRLHAFQDASDPGAIPTGQGVFIAVLAEHGRKQRKATFGMRTISARGKIKPIHLPAKTTVIPRVPYLFEVLL